MIVEGILVLDALSGVGRHADFLVYVRGEGGNGLSKVISDYNSRQRPEANAQFTLASVSTTCLNRWREDEKAAQSSQTVANL